MVGLWLWRGRCPHPIRCGELCAFRQPTGGPRFRESCPALGFLARWQMAAHPSLALAECPSCSSGVFPYRWSMDLRPLQLRSANTTGDWARRGRADLGTCTAGAVA
jgi:hypothetical protein